MADHTPTTFNSETLSSISARLCDRAAEVADTRLRLIEVCTGLTDDLKLAARVATKLASLRSEVAQISRQTGDVDTRRELRDALSEAEAL
jgi:hypothetical protein